MCSDVMQCLHLKVFITHHKGHIVDLLCNNQQEKNDPLSLSMLLNTDMI